MPQVEGYQNYRGLSRKQKKNKMQLLSNQPIKEKERRDDKGRHYPLTQRVFRIINVLVKKDLCLKVCTFASNFTLEFFCFILLPSTKASNLSQTWVNFLSPEEYFITLVWEAIGILSCI